MPKLAANIDGQNQAKGVNFVDPTSAQDLATKNYVDAVATGLEPKPAVAAVAVANVTKSGTQTIDGVALSATQRVLLTGQTTASENGPWVVQSGAWTRPIDFPAAGTASPGAYCLVEAGTVYKGTGWIMTGTTAVTIDTTSQTWQQFTGAGDLSANSPLSISGNVISLGSAVPVNLGGTGGTTAAAAKTNLGFTTKYASDIGDGSNASLSKTHSLGTTDLSSVLVYRKSDGVVVDPDITIVDANNITIGFGFIPTSNSYRLIVTA